MAFVVEKQWQMQYCVNHAETGYMEDVQDKKCDKYSCNRS